MRQLIAFALKRIRGVRIVEANDGVDGLKKLSSERFDLILGAAFILAVAVLWWRTRKAPVVPKESIL